MTTTWELEQKIGVRPWLGDHVILELHPRHIVDVQQWLLAQSMPPEKLATLKWSQMQKCYCIKPYFNVVAGITAPRGAGRANKSFHRQQAGLKVGDALDLLGGEEVDDDKNDDYENLLASIEKQEQSQSKGDVESNPDLLPALYKHIKTEVNQATGQLPAKIQFGVLNTLRQELQAGTTKLPLADEMVEKIVRLGTQAAEEYMAANLPPRELIIKNCKTNAVTPLGHQHFNFPILLKALECELHVMLVGMASSSKTTSARIAAEALGLDFYHMGAAASEFKFAGYQDGHGKYHTTPFREAFEHGGEILLDEYDGCVPAATMFIQAALANRTCHFPDKIIAQHPRFLCIAACNTYGRGQDRQYVGRNQQDAANMDRFVVLDWDIDESLEAMLYGDGKPVTGGFSFHTVPEFSTYPELSPGDWVRYVQKIRHAIIALGERHLVTMRASDYGNRLLQAGLPLATVEQMTIWKGLNPSLVEKIRHHAQL